MSFASLNLKPLLLDAVIKCGYTAPTPIQTKSIPIVLEGKDVMGLAQTGTGKTAAFVLPALQRLLDGPRGRVRALVLAPTRELAEQTHDAFGTLGHKTRLKSVAVYGGVGIGPQVRNIRNGAEIVVACPGRLLDLLGQGLINLSGVEILVLDEADRMFDMGFLPDIKRIMKQLPATRQTLMFSATMPDDIRKLAHEVLHNPVTVQVGHSAPAASVKHAIYPVEQHLKTPLLIGILKNCDSSSALIFTRTKHRANRVSEQLERAGFRATAIQGNLSQNRRQAALDGFRDGKYQVLVATDIAARGIDVSSISHVINYDIPDTADAYTHRIGRTGRAAKEGDAFTLVTREDVGMVRSIERVLGSEIERRKLEGFDYTMASTSKDAEFDRPPREPQRRRGHSDGRQAPKRAAAPVFHRGSDGRPSSERPQAATARPQGPQARSFRPRGQR